jgi:hypothetical protein
MTSQATSYLKVSEEDVIAAIASGDLSQENWECLRIREALEAYLQS